MDLARPRFRCLGRLADRLVRTRTPFCVATFVYIDMAVGGAPLEFRVRTCVRMYVRLCGCGLLAPSHTCDPYT